MGSPAGDTPVVSLGGI